MGCYCEILTNVKETEEASVVNCFLRSSRISGIFSYENVLKEPRILIKYCFVFKVIQILLFFLSLN